MPNAVASNPARVTVNPLVWVRHYKAAPLILAALLVLSVVAFFVITLDEDSPKLAARLKLLPVLFGIVNVLYWVGVAGSGRKGNVNPGVVLQTEPMLIAILADMGKSGTPYYALKIIKQPVYGQDGKLLPPGSKLATAAEYGDTNSNKNPDRWGNLNPIPVPCFTNDAATLNRVMATIDDEEWELLDNALREVPEREPGIYFLSSRWQDGSHQS